MNDARDSGGSAAKVLVLDENFADAGRVRRCLEEAFGDRLARIDHASSTDEAAERMARSSYDVFLLDYRSGGAAADLVPSLRARGIATPVIVLTGPAHEELGARAIRAGLRELVLKSALSAASLTRAIGWMAGGPALA